MLSLVFGICLAQAQPPAAGTAAAQHSPAASADPADAGDKDDKGDKGDKGEKGDKGDKGELLRDSRVIFPTHIGAFTLYRSTVDPQVEAGVNLQYNYGGDVGLDFDIFVYPLGRTWEREALELALQELLGSFKAAENAGYYSQVELRKPRDVSMQVDPLLRVRGVTPPSSPLLTLRGKHVVFDAQKHGTPMTSHSLLFYRSYYLIKLRLSVLDKARRRDADKLVDAALRELLPRIRLQHAGCTADMTMAFTGVDRLERGADSSNGDGTQVLLPRKGSERVKKELTTQAVGRRLDIDCAEKFDDKFILTGEKSETLRFKPGDWAISIDDRKAPHAAGN